MATAVFNKAVCDLNKYIFLMSWMSQKTNCLSSSMAQKLSAGVRLKIDTWHHVLWQICSKVLKSLHSLPSAFYPDATDISRAPTFWTPKHKLCDDCALDSKQLECNLWDTSQCGLLQNWRSCMNSTVVGWMMWMGTGSWMLETLLLYVLLAACSRGLSVILLQVFHLLRVSKGHWDRWRPTGTERNSLWWPDLWV